MIKLEYVGFCDLLALIFGMFGGIRAIKETPLVELNTNHSEDKHEQPVDNGDVGNVLD